MISVRIGNMDAKIRSMTFYLMINDPFEPFEKENLRKAFARILTPKKCSLHD